MTTFEIKALKLTRNILVRESKLYSMQEPMSGLIEDAIQTIDTILEYTET